MASKPDEDSEQTKRLKDRFNLEAKRMRRQHTILGTVFDFYHGFSDRGGWIDTIGHGQRSRPGQPKEMTKKQVLRALKIAHAKGWTTVRFVRNGKIDQNATNIAKSLMGSGEPLSVHNNIERINKERKAAISAEITNIHQQMAVHSEKLSELAAQGLDSSPEAQSIRKKNQNAKDELEKVQNYFRFGTWRHGLEVSSILPDKAFAHLGIHHRIIPAFRIPFLIAVGIPGTHALKVEQQKIMFERARLKAHVADKMQFI
jgi:hypothetical protein